jgi:hypothetical protein
MSRLLFLLAVAEGPPSPAAASADSHRFGDGQQARRGGGVDRHVVAHAQQDDVRVVDQLRIAVLREPVDCRFDYHTIFPFLVWFRFVLLWPVNPTNDGQISSHLANSLAII